MGTNTTNYGFMKPTVGADSDVWGADFTATDTPLTDPSPGLNGNWEKLDQMLAQMNAALTAVTEAAKVPVGGLYFSTTDNEPDETLGYGTWTAFAEGRAIVGVGTANEGVNPITWAALDENGTDDAMMLDTEMPEHEHSVPSANLTTSEDGEHTHNFVDQPIIGNTDTARVAWTADGGVGNAYTPTLANAGEHTHTVSFPTTVTDTTFSARTALSRVQPSIAVYIWLRTA